MATTRGANGHPLMMTDGPNRGVDPPFNYDMNSQDSLAGATQIPSQLYSEYHFFNLHGPDCTVRVSEAMRIHMIEIKRVWFTLPEPEDPALVLPIDNTLWLTMSVCERAGRNNIHTAISTFSTDSAGVITNYEVVPDPGQEANALYPSTAMVFPLGQGAVAGTQVVEENYAKLKNNLIGVSQSNINIRFRLRQRDGTTYYGGVGPNAPMNDVRIYVELFFWAEKRT